jgi:hypothetical protein
MVYDHCRDCNFGHVQRETMDMAKEKNTIMFRRLALPPFSGGTEKGTGLRLASANGLTRAGSTPFPFPPDGGCR